MLTQVYQIKSQVYPIKSDDFFPYASGLHSYWTGYFTSRPSIKVFIVITSLHYHVKPLLCTLIELQEKLLKLQNTDNYTTITIINQTFFLAGGEGGSKGLK